VATSSPTLRRRLELGAGPAEPVRSRFKSVRDAPPRYAVDRDRFDSISGRVATLTPGERPFVDSCSESSAGTASFSAGTTSVSIDKESSSRGPHYFDRYDIIFDRSGIAFDRYDVVYDRDGAV